MNTKEFHSFLQILDNLPTVKYYKDDIRSVYHEGQLYLINKSTMEYLLIYKGYETTADKFLGKFEMKNSGYSFGKLDPFIGYGYVDLGNDKLFIFHSEDSFSEVSFSRTYDQAYLYYYIHGKELSEEEFKIHKNKASLKEKMKNI